MNLFVKSRTAKVGTGLPDARTTNGVRSAGWVLAITFGLGAGAAIATEQLEPEPEPAAAAAPRAEAPACAAASKQCRAVSGAKAFSGKAGYYARQLHGHPTASGRPYDHGKMTCAHKTLPFGTKLKVVSRKNQRAVMVVVNDRGPHSPGMVLDLSGEAARQLGMIGDGLHHVDCYIVKPEVAAAASDDSDM